jgi:SAM-dependent methyltransferase
MSSQQSGELFASWDLYGNIIAQNWMRHREMGAFLRSVVGELEERKRAGDADGLRVLDLGCGDGSMAAEGLVSRRVASYVGVDLSEEALTKLMGREGLGSARRTICGSIPEEFPKISGESFDLVIASYSLHHFVSSVKEGILREIHRLLSRDGCFVWIDIYRRGEDSREEFLRRIDRFIHEEWNPMPEDARVASLEHIQQCDYPELESWMLDAWASVAGGVHKVRKGYCDDFFGSWVFTR